MFFTLIIFRYSLLNYVLINTQNKGMTFVRHLVKEDYEQNNFESQMKIRVTLLIRVSDSVVKVYFDY